MESTGKYWIPIFNILETHMHVILTHPKYVKAIKGKKTDKRDARWIANLFRFDIVKASFIPPPEDTGFTGTFPLPPEIVLHAFR